MADLVFKNTTATKKIFRLRKRIRAVSGGTSASKTISILVWCIDYSQSTKNKKVDIISESFPHLELGAIADFQAIMKAQGYWRQERWNETKHIYTFERGSRIRFYSVDKLGKAHGPRRDVLFLNECNHIEYLIADQLITRTREVVWLDWNPSTEFWFYTEMLPNRTDIDFITVTYLDNEALEPSLVAEIESHRNNKNWWQVYGLGQLGEVEGKIYKGWEFLDGVPEEARLVRYGIDFGYSNDPTAIVAIYRYNKGYVINELAFQKELSNRQIALVFRDLPKALIIADSAEPKSIDELKSYGLMVMPATKGPGSVEQGIQYVQGQKIYVTNQSQNVIKEYRNYLWMTDKDGKIINVPDHKFSHSMDGIRYPLVSLRDEKDKPTKAKTLEEKFRERIGKIKPTTFNPNQFYGNSTRTR